MACSQRETKVIDLPALAKGKLTDPILMEWALERHRDAKQDPGLQQAMELAWFDEMTLRRWLDSEDEVILARLFARLPAERFCHLGQAIGERWPHWSGNLAYHSAPVLARYQPNLAWKCFAQPVGGRHPDFDAVRGIIRSLPMLAPEPGRALLKAIAEDAVTSSRKGGFPQDIALNSLISAALEMDREVANALIRARLRDARDDSDLDQTLSDISIGLFGHDRFRELASAIRNKQTRQSFRSLAPLFTDEAPLRQLDHWSRRPVTLTDLTGLLDAFVDHQDRGIVQSVIETLKAKGLAQHWDKVADFLIGVTAAACERNALDISPMSLEETVGLLSADLHEPPYFESLLTHLDAFDPGEVSARLSEALDREKATYGSVNIVEVMGRLRWHRFVPQLIDAIGEDCGDLLCEAARDALVRIGRPAQESLIQEWDRLDASQRIYGMSVIVAIGGEQAASFAAARYDDLLGEDPESWCRLAVAAPERCLLDLLERCLPRRQASFDETFYTLARLLDSDHSQLPAVGERVRKRRAEQQARLAAFERGDWFCDALTLDLRCPECGDVNEYRVQRIAVDPGAPNATPLVAQEFACASCGTWAEFELTAEARLAVTAELIKLAADSEAGLAGKSKVLIRAEVPLDGRGRPVGEVVSHCKAAVAKNLGSIADWLRLGLCYHQVLCRPRLGLKYAERALRLEPNAVEAVIQKADALARQGDDAPAFELLDHALASKDHWRFFLTDVSTPAQVAGQFARLYNELRRQLGRADRLSLHGSFLGASRKVGRNDPCPCGSGKKYKKCCLARH
jgi:tetratricopeptide (TPR) repeat protein